MGSQQHREVEKPELRDRIRALQDEVLCRPATGLEADKAFYDWLSSEEDRPGESLLFKGGDFSLTDVEMA